MESIYEDSVESTTSSSQGFNTVQVSSIVSCSLVIRDVGVLREPRVKRSVPSDLNAGVLGGL